MSTNTIYQIEDVEGKGNLTALTHQQRGWPLRASGWQLRASPRSSQGPALC